MFLSDYTKFYRVLLGYTKFCQVFLCITGLYWVLLGLADDFTV